MKKVRLFLVFALMIATALCVTSCALMATTCSVHRDINRDGVCDVCSSTMPVSCKSHEDLDHDGLCDTEGCGWLMKVVHFDDDHDGMCDELYCTHGGMYFEHIDEDYDRKCDDCDADMEIDCEECYDDDEDGFCDECEYPIIVCEHRDRVPKDGICDKCKEPMPAAPQCSHKDSNTDGVCDLCGEGMPGTIPLVDKDGKTSYKFVLGTGLGSYPRRMITYLIDDLDGLGVQIEQNKEAAVDYEVLFGTINNRESKYILDVHDYGIKGYTVQVIDNKIIVLAGSDDAYIEAIEILRTDFFGLTEAVLNRGEQLKSVYVYSDKNVTKVQDDYNITQITLFGEDIREYKIAYDMSAGIDTTVLSETKKAATALQKLLYENAGYWLDIVDASQVTDKIIFFGKVDKCGDNAFAAKFESGKISFTSEYTTSLEKVPCDFFLDMLTATSETKILALTDAYETNARFTKNAHYVYYDDFGAVGDGNTNDAGAIYDAHDFANRGGHKKVVGTSGKTYLIGEIPSASACIVMCDVDWTGVKFILDDREGIITNGYRGSIFEVRGSASTSISPSKTGLAGGFKASEMTEFDIFGDAETERYPAMVFVSNSSHKYFIREGVNANDGNTQKEVILIDAEGNIDPKAMFLFDYEKVTGITAYKIDTNSVTPITIEGGEFTTRAHNQTTSSTYTGQRGITIYRSHTTMKNVKHYVVGEPDSDKGSAYPNFVDVQNAYNVLITDCVFTAHKTYYNIKGTSKVGLGTYDITTHNSLEVTFRNCTQSNFYADPDNIAKGTNSGTWGINGGGGSKRVTYDGCLLSRFDAHTGIMHAYIINSIVGSIDVCGGGNLHVINTKVYGSPMIRFREDYGAFWIGDVIVKDSAIIEKNTLNTIETAQLFNVSWVNHDFGYKTSLPTSIIVDNLQVFKSDQVTRSTTAKFFNFFSASYVNNSDKYDDETLVVVTDGVREEVANKNIMTPPGSIIVRNNTQGLVYQQIHKLTDVATLSEKDYFKNTHVEEIPVGTEVPECTGHVDADGNFVCDICWEYMSALVCRKHSDTDGDGYCDALACKAEMPTE